MGINIAAPAFDQRPLLKIGTRVIKGKDIARLYSSRDADGNFDFRKDGMKKSLDAFFAAVFFLQIAGKIRPEIKFPGL